MPQKSPIEWTDYTSNPIRARDRETGKVGWSCVKISMGCKNCYAEAINGRFGTKLGYNAAGAARAELFVNDAELAALLKIRKPARVFLGDMTDVFQEGVTDDMLDRLFAVMALCKHLTFQVLTKRAARMAAYLDPAAGAMRRWSRTLERDWLHLSPCLGHLIDDLDGGEPWPLPNLWAGVSVEDQARADDRIPHLLRTPSAVRFLSVEPLLGPVDLRQVVTRGHWERSLNALDGSTMVMTRDGGGGVEVGPAIDWVIVGGESGKGARRCELRWIRAVVAQCQAAGVPCFVKQLGGNLDDMDSDECSRLSGTSMQHAKGGDPSEWPADLRVRQFPKGGIS